MITNILKKIIGTKNERELKRIQPLIEKANNLEEGYKALSDEQLRAKTPFFKERLEQGEELDALLPEAFAAAREAARRTVNMRHFDVQLIGGVILHEGRIAEMATGEGKTLVATLPVYLNALTGLGVHVITVNDYLAKRDAEWMGPVYKFLGLSVGVIVHGLDDDERKIAYASDVTYGTNNEFGFDYLRDNMKYSIDECVHREYNYAIVDEVDSILIDEARTPLIISGPAEESTDKYYKINRLIYQLKQDKDFMVDEKAKSAYLTEEGVARIEKLINIDNLYDPKYVDLLHHVNQALKAHNLFQRDVDYIVKDGQVIIVDEFTGRLMPGRRFSDGLHQALEAKENVKIERENQTLATVTFQNYFRMYKKLAGMTGTADTEAVEFKKIYNLDVTVIPTNKSLIRTNYADVVYRTEKEKFKAAIEEIEDLHKRGKPVLVGTLSIDKSEKVAETLKRKGIPHHILNAKNHESEAEVIAQAGRSKAVTISTNMAGRGTDILLGGNPIFLALNMAKGQKDTEEFSKALEEAKKICEKDKEEVIKLGGLHILGTERHESRRIDNQLRGRAGRQGDPGSSRFYVSLEDEIMRLFGGDKVSPMLAKLGMTEDMPIEHPFISKAIENAQTRVEGHNFEIRKYLLDYDNVMNKQRETVYGMRREFMENDDVRDRVFDMIDEICENLVFDCAPEKVYPEEWDMVSLKNRIFESFFFHIDLDSLDLKSMTREGLFDVVKQKVLAVYERKDKEFGDGELKALERYIALNSLDMHWKEHLLALDHLKEGIGLRGYAQKDPLREYQRESFELVLDMLDRVKMDTVRKLFAIQPAREELTHEQPVMFFNKGNESPRETKDKKIGRNDPCSCGSGKKYKKCCGK
jgi:preprotein translocase subunit SecA